MVYQFAVAYEKYWVKVPQKGGGGGSITVFWEYEGSTERIGVLWVLIYADKHAGCRGTQPIERVPTGIPDKVSSSS